MAQGIRSWCRFFGVENSSEERACLRDDKAAGFEEELCGCHLRGSVLFYSLSQTLMKVVFVLTDLLVIVNVLPSSDTLNSEMLSGVPLI
jgi:hypothetical protein